jgi:hypothetical protein
MNPLTWMNGGYKEGGASHTDVEERNRVSSYRGYLYKLRRSQNLLAPQWGKRWFTIEGHFLKWYRSETDLCSSGMVDLKYIRSIVKLENSVYGNAFHVTCEERSLILRCANASDLNNWIRALHIQADIARGGTGMNVVSDFNQLPVNHNNNIRRNNSSGSSGNRRTTKTRASLTLEEELDLTLKKLDELEREVATQQDEQGDISTAAAAGPEKERGNPDFSISASLDDVPVRVSQHSLVPTASRQQQSQRREGSRGREKDRDRERRDRDRDADHNQLVKHSTTRSQSSRGSSHSNNNNSSNNRSLERVDSMEDIELPADKKSSRSRAALKSKQQQKVQLDTFSVSNSDADSPQLHVRVANRLTAKSSRSPVGRANNQSSHHNLNRHVVRVDSDEFEYSDGESQRLQQQQSNNAQSRQRGVSVDFEEVVEDVYSRPHQNRSGSHSRSHSRTRTDNSNNIINSSNNNSNNNNNRNSNEFKRGVVVERDGDSLRSSRAKAAWVDN